MTKSEARAQLRAQKKQFAITGIPPEFNQHEWKRGLGILVCKNCGLVKGSGFAKCELAKPDDYDPTPWCSGCGAMKASQCNCGPLAEND